MTACLISPLGIRAGGGLRYPDGGERVAQHAHALHEHLVEGVAGDGGWVSFRGESAAIDRGTAWRLKECARSSRLHLRKEDC